MDRLKFYRETLQDIDSMIDNILEEVGAAAVWTDLCKAVSNCPGMSHNLAKLSKLVRQPALSDVVQHFSAGGVYSEALYKKGCFRFLEHSTMEVLSLVRARNNFLSLTRVFREVIDV